MKNLLLFIALFSASVCSAQQKTMNDDVYAPKDSVRYSDWKSGYIVPENAKDTIHGLLDIREKGSMWLSGGTSISVHIAGQKDKRYAAGKVSFFEYKDSAGRWQRYEPFAMTGDGSKVFVKQYAAGRCRIFVITRPDVIATALFGMIGALLAEQETVYLIQKGTSSLWAIQKTGFKKDMSEFFQKCPDMVSKIKEGTFTYDNWKTMVTYYNNNGCH